jgi:FtsZ-interacting cell division protein ZipA
MSSMMVVLLIAGLGLVLAGLLTVGFGVQLDLSLGNTLILAGAITACTGMILLGIWTVVRELKNIARRLGAGVAAESDVGTTLQSAAAGAREDGSFLFSRDQPAAENAGNAEPAAPSPSPLPWHEEAASRDRVRGDVPSPPEPVEAAPGLKPRRNLLFSSSSRKERERAQARTTEPSAADLRPASPGPASPAAPPPPESTEVPPATFDDAWPKPERSRAVDAPPRRSGRAPSTFTEANAAAPAADRHPPAARNEDQPPVTVLKSGVVDGMAYSLYSDGSIEAQMPEGMMRFASIDELRAHLDQRP